MFKKIIHTFIPFVIICFCLTSCSKDNPLEPTVVVAFGGNLLNSNFQATILQAELLFDGSSVATANFATPSGGTMLSGSLTSVKKGAHTISFKITNQTSSPNTYETVGANVVTETSRFMLGDLRQSLATGQSITFSITI